MSAGNSGRTENYSQAVSTRLTKRTKGRYDRFRDEHELGNAQALRRLVRTGLKQEQTGTRPAERSTARHLTTVVAVAAAGLVALGEIGAVFVLLGVHLLSIWLWSTWPYVEPYVQSLRDRLS